MNDHRRAESALKKRILKLFRDVDEFHGGDPGYFDKAMGRSMEELHAAAAAGEIPPPVLEGLKRKVQRCDFESIS